MVARKKANENDKGIVKICSTCTHCEIFFTLQNDNLTLSRTVVCGMIVNFFDLLLSCELFYTIMLRKFIGRANSYLSSDLFPYISRYYLQI